METNIKGNKLSGSKDSGFKVPDAYFDDMETQILSKVVYGTEQSKPRIGSLWVKSFYAMVSAAVILIAFMLLKPSADVDFEAFAYQPPIELYSDYDELWLAQEIDLGIEDAEFDEQLNSLLNDGVTNTEILDMYINNY